MGRSEAELAMCPSGRCHDGALLIGIVGPDGRIGPVRPPLAVEAEFVQQFGDSAESRFRFAEPCAEQRCGHWGSGQCGLVDLVIDEIDPAGSEAATLGLRPCAIRRSCRWYAQRGGQACAVCPLVVRRPPT